MSQFSCLVQEASAADTSRGQLEERLAAMHEAHYPGESTSVTWRAIPAGHMFTEGRQSTSSIIACQLGHTTTIDEREGYMRAVCDLWTDVTGCTDHEIVVSLSEAPSA
ncbi:MAG: hypothetical protein AAF567_04715 [Actinomycetota bacterium]